ncbi:MAG: hypothetical protein LBB88_06485, partial [Planctomycetaceae bacterium]|nr:hypothetical protein [Planctomycetaceae bacterium]
MSKRKIQKKRFESTVKIFHSANNRCENQFADGDDIDLNAKIDIALNNKIPPTLNTKIRRKQDGIFYTEKRITSYIVSKTIGKLCADKKVELGLDNEESFNQIINQNSKSNNNQKKVTSNPILEKLEKYRRWLLSLSICDPACGSGAFLNAALDFLKEEHYFIDKFTAQILGHSIV